MAGSEEDAWRFQAQEPIGFNRFLLCPRLQALEVPI